MIKVHPSLISPSLAGRVRGKGLVPPTQRLPGSWIFQNHLIARNFLTSVTFYLFVRKLHIAAMY